MKTTIHKAQTRGHANHGWLDAYHSFSFANYNNPSRVHFGVLRVLNDDTVAPGMGFAMHPHNNMEIITIPLEGDLEHRDDMGNTAIIRKGDIQVMSAGTGVLHSERNPNRDKAVKLLQIWIFPNERNVTPRYDQMSLNIADRQNKLQQVLSPNIDDEGVWIHQEAYFHMGTFDAGFQTQYVLKQATNGVYVFVIKGEVTVNGQTLAQRDGLGVWEVDALAITAESAGAEVLLMEVPMQLA